MQTAKLEAVFTADTKDFDKGVKGVKRSFNDLSKDMGKGFKSVGDGIGGLGRDLLSITAPLAAGFGVAIKSAMDFDSTMANIGAIMGKTSGEMAGLRAEILAIGGASTFGPQLAAEAFAEIAGGVLDSSTHMAIFNQAIATAEAGQANLQATTAGLVSTMNSYKFSAEQAAYASDVMTQTVGMGVGSMDELAAAMPMVTGLAASLGISFDEIGGSMAYLSTQGFSFSQAGTQLRAMMTALLNPNEKMRAALAELGVETGQALIETHGLVGAYELLAGTGMAEKEFAAMLGSTEALTGATALLSTEAGGATVFMNQFSESLNGATERARAIQLDSATAQFDMLKAKLGELSVTVGTAILPALNDLLVAVTPIITEFARWAAENPQTVAEVAKITAVIAGLAAVALPIAGIITGIAGALGVLTSPIGVAIGLFAALGAAINGVIQSWNNWQNTVLNTPRELLSPEGFSRLQAGLGTTSMTNIGMIGAAQDALRRLGVGGNALGGDVRVGQWSWVGEDGPELVRFGRSGTVFSNPATVGGNNYGGRMMGGNGLHINGGTYNFYGVQDIDQLYDQLMQIESQRS